MTAPPSADEVARPAYVPAHRLPVWLSSEDVKTAIFSLAEREADKATCFDMLMQINHLIGETK